MRLSMFFQFMQFFLMRLFPFKSPRKLTEVPRVPHCETLGTTAPPR